jgi:hypothetical protein
MKRMALLSPVAPALGTIWFLLLVGASGCPQAQAGQQGINATVGPQTPSIMTFNAPGAGTGSNQGTYALNITKAGEIAGEYVDGNNAAHGFVRRP